ncbi:Phosphomannomutase [Smittium culicis]|uniref:Phosphomannomutase n=1 Tax=Smittium culicis TaxID=133412 RepID=A0A1R1YRJ1_9FUNG|nr:Phosphomannomutase [Smittium culicis]
MSAPWKSRQLPKTICLFDVDGTLTPSRGKIGPEMKDALARLRQICAIGFLGGSDLSKQHEQLGNNILDEFDFCFSENGLVSFRCGEPLPKQSFIGFLGEDKYKKFIKFVLHYIADLDIPIKRGTFVEFRNGMINVCPIGRNCSQEERKAFLEIDNKHGYRAEFVAKLEKEFPDYGLKYSIGGEISFDVFPVGWDKTFALNHLKNEDFDAVHFFGDKTMPGGNDYEIYTCDGVIGHSVKNPENTLETLNKLFGI